MVQCSECGTEASAANGVIVGETTNYPEPICNECWALWLKGETVLSEREAQVAALKDYDLPHREIASILDIKKSTVDTLSVRTREKVRLARRTTEEIGHYDLN